MPLRRLLFAVVVSCCPALAQATPIVDLQRGDGWVTGNTNGLAGSGTYAAGDFDNDGTADDGRVRLPFSTSSQLSPATGYQSGAFYGGYAAYWLNDAATKFGANQVRNNTQDGTNDTYELGTATGTVAAYRSFVLWRKSEFLAGSGDGEQVNLTSDTAISLSARSVNTTGVFRWLIQKGSSYYVSEATASNTSFASAPIVSSGLTTTLWAEIDPAAAIDSLAAPTLTFAALSLTDIDGVGFYFASTASSSNGRVQFSGFTVDASVVVPEPASLALAGLAGVAVLARRR